MKKILMASFAFAALALLGTGCLKDKGFNNQQYGLVVPDQKGVSFPQSRSVSSILYGIVSSVNADSVKGPFISLESAAQSSDIHLTLSVNDALVTADPTLTVLPASEYTVDLNRTIRAGFTLDSVYVVLLHSANL